MELKNKKKDYVSPCLTIMEIQMNACILAGDSGGNGGNAGGDNMGNGGEYGRNYDDDNSPWAYGIQ